MGRLVREAILQTGLGQRRVDSPLSEIIEPGMTVLVKPNWVLHRNESNHGMDCMVTHHAFTRAAIREVFKAHPARVILGDAPIQLCRWEELVTEEFCRRLEQDAFATGVELSIVDFRRTVARNATVADGVQKERREERHYCLFDLGTDSLLEPISNRNGRFRVTCYDPRELAKSHARGRHRYLICRDVFEADVVLSLPKLKTHRKTGLTGALKNLVGINGNKEFLPHHRVGGATAGGDCYPGRSLRKRWVEFCLDMANRRIGQPGYAFWGRQARRHWSQVAAPEEGSLEGSWHGNDTCWRMVLDLNRILLYGRADGTMAEEKQRTLWTLTDGIICGEGEGPLAPSPIALGAVTFSGCASAAEMVHAALLGFDWTRLPLIRESLGRFRWPLCDPFEEPESFVDGDALGLTELADRYGVQARPPAGWEGFVEKVK